MTENKRRAWQKSKDPASVMLSRLLASMPAATFEMETFARLAGVVASKEVPTAAMETKHRPRLLLNPEFVEKYCQRDEHLFLLVMHELWHVLLAHTSLYPRITTAQNIAFDAIINAGLMRRFRAPAYQGFFEQLNPPDKFPHMLLRPPEGWPDNPHYPVGIGPQGTERVLRQLYPAPGSRRQTMPFYDEILDLIKQDMEEKGLLTEMPVLLGDHESSDAYKSDFLKEAMGRVTKKWPMNVGEFGPPGQGGNLDNWQLDPLSATQSIRRRFADILKLALGYDLGAYRRRQRLPIPADTGNGVFPNPRDRLTVARKRLGFPGTLWLQNTTVKARVPERKVRAFVYLDVSGSMSDILPYLLNLLLPYVNRGLANVYQFSTEVEHLSLQDLQHGVVQSTGGTQIACVVQHMLEQDEPLRRVLILTDGYTGRPHFAAVRKIREDGTKVYVVLPGESPYEDDLGAIATSFTVLPKLRY